MCMLLLQCIAHSLYCFMVYVIRSYRGNFGVKIVANIANADIITALATNTALISSPCKSEAS